MHSLLNGAGPWQESGNWRESISTADLAVRYLLPIAENYAAFDQADFQTLAEIGAAAAFLRKLPSQMRGNNSIELVRLLKQDSTGPKRGVVRGLIGFAVNPLGSSIKFATNQIGKHLLSDDETIAHFTSVVEAAVVDTQLEYVWTHASDFPYSSEFDQEAGRRAYWFAFIRNEANQLSQFSTDFILTPDVANQALQRSNLEIQEVRNNPVHLAEIWYHSPLFASSDTLETINRANEMNKIHRKLARGKTIPQVDQAFDHYRQTANERERHINGYAVRMRWSGA